MKFTLLNRRLLTIVVLLVMVSALIAATSTRQQTTTQLTGYYFSQLDSIKVKLVRMEQGAPNLAQADLIQLFENARLHFKNIEAIVEYNFPASAARLNGAPLLESEPSQPNEPVHPEGFQVLEAIIYGDLDKKSRESIVFEVSNLITATNKLMATPGNVQLSSSNVMDALRLNLYRMIVKGITGFDNPVGFKGIREAEATLAGTRLLLSYFPRSVEVQQACTKAIGYIKANGYDFNSFDRAVFISKYMNPLCVALYDYQSKEHIPFESQSAALSTKAKHLFAENAFDITGFAPDGTTAVTKEQIVLGRKLFFDPSFSSTGNRSCGSCHQPGKAFTDGLKTNESILNGSKLSRNTPTLINAALQPAQFYDSRISFLEDQAHDVISNSAEMGGTLHAIAQELSKDDSYRKLFRSAYPDRTITTDNIKKALAAYVRSLTRMNSPFDQYMRGNERAMTPAQLRGFNLFAGKAKCATCHFMPLFSGAVAPLYRKIESEVLGVPVNTDTLHAKLDEDKGKYNLYHIPHQLYAFKTTSVRNSAATAPYMHNGVYQTLEEVIDFYDRGGGAGLGFDLPNQTLSGDRLQLSAIEKKDLILFLGALTDTAGLR